MAPKATSKTVEQAEHDGKYLYRRYTVGLEFISGIAGGQPMTPGRATAYAQRFSLGVSNDLKAGKKNMGEVTEEAIAKYLLSASSGFDMDDIGIFIRGFQVNAMLKDTAQRMKATMKIKGLSNTIRDGGLLFPDKIHLHVDPHIVERPVKPDNGPANIKIFQVANDVKLALPCAVLENGDLPDLLFRQMWIVAQGLGLGANRHLGYGRFLVADIKQEGDWNIAELFQNGATVLAGNTTPVP